MKYVSLFLFLALFQNSFAATYQVDPNHSHMGFKVKHLMLVDVYGSFDDFEGTFDFDEKKNALSNLGFEVRTKSVDTNVEKRDNHLRTADFFNVEKFPTMNFKNAKLKGEKGKYKLAGDLTLLGVTKPVTFDLVYTGTKKDMEGKMKAGFSAKGKINRKDFGMGWNAPVYGGGVMVSEDVDLMIEVEAFEQTK